MKDKLQQLRNKIDEIDSKLVSVSNTNETSRRKKKKNRYVLLFGATADVYLPNAERAKEWAGPNAKAYQDFRRLLEQKDIDAVLVATPDHWHATAAVLACQAGKDAPLCG